MDAGDLTEISDQGAFDGLSAADYLQPSSKPRRLGSNSILSR